MSAAQRVLQQLVDELGPGGILTGSDVAWPYVRDWARDRTGQCVAVLRPDSVAAVSRICAVCADAGIGVIPQGGHTGLVGGAQRLRADCVLVSTERLRTIREIDSDNMTVTVEAGVVLERLQIELAGHGLEFPISIGSQGTAQVGGLISTNAGGVQVVRHGMTGTHVQGLELVLADGRIASSISGLHKDNRGPDPLRLAIGGEGAFGIVTAACLRLIPRHLAQATAYVGCDTFEAALSLFRHVRTGAYECLTGFEVMSAACMPLARLVDPELRPPFEAQVHVLIRLGAAARLPLGEMLETLLADALEKGLARDVVVAQSDRQAAWFWALREGIVEGHSRRGFHVRSDVSVRLGKVPVLVHVLEQMLAQEFPDWIPQAYGHMGDGNIHFNALPPDGLSDEAARETGARIETRIFDVTLSLEGSFSAEHGIGRTKADWFARTADPGRLHILRGIKSALDPNWLMNPGCLLAQPEDVA
jgi:FAD/FMN-containing dehydrogenase